LKTHPPLLLPYLTRINGIFIHDKSRYLHYKLIHCGRPPRPANPPLTEIPRPAAPPPLTVIPRPAVDGERTVTPDGFGSDFVVGVEGARIPGSEELIVGFLGGLGGTGGKAFAFVFFLSGCESGLGASFLETS
jgi:hypothetical protein